MKPCPLCKAAVSETAQFPPDSTSCGSCGRNCMQVRQNPALPPGAVEYSDLAGPSRASAPGVGTANAAFTPKVPPMNTAGGSPTSVGYGPPPTVPGAVPPPPRVPGSTTTYAPPPPTGYGTSAVQNGFAGLPTAGGWNATQTSGTTGMQGAGMAANTSGTKGVIPPEVAGRSWSWGAFGCGPIWLMGHNMVPQGVFWLLMSIVLGRFPLIFLINIGISIFLGKAGNQLAWQTRRFESVEQFKAVQRAWDMWGIALFLLYVLLMLGVMILLMNPPQAPAYNPYQQAPYNPYQ